MPLSLKSPPRNPPLLNLLKLLGHINLFDHHSHLSCLIPSRFLDFLKVNNPPGKTSIGPPFQSALNPGQGSAPHMNNYVHPTRLTGGRKTLLIIDRKVRNRACLIDLMSNFQVDLSARLFHRVDYIIAIP
ncbi:hypothetical protein D6C93_09486 [Aureobasidium pullulans]|nr:hypothetical protein D6C93_09486 [Aureobasidium pullulans]